MTTSRTRLLPSLALFGSFTFLGIFISGLGPAIPSLSRRVAVADVSLGAGVALRGLGYLLGSSLSSVTLPVDQGKIVHCMNDRMARLGAATVSIGLFAVALDVAQTFWAVCLFCFCQGLCGGCIDAIGNAAISSVHGTDVAPWVQGLHFCFSAGAFLAPVAVGQMGYRAAFLVFGLLALPVGLACCLTSGAAAAAAAASPSVEGRKHRLLVSVENGEEDGGDDGAGAGLGHDRHLGNLASGGDVEMVEVMDKRRLRACGTIGQRDLSLSQQHPQDGRLESQEQPAPQRLREGSDGDGCVGASSTRHLRPRQEEARGEQEVQDGLLLLSEKEAAHDAIIAQQAQQHQQSQPAQNEKLPLHLEEQELGGTHPPFPLVGLLVLFFFVYVGIEVGFGAWIAVVVLRDGLAGEAGAALMASLFWGGITVGRLLAIPLTVRLPAGLLLRANLVGGLLSSGLLCFFGKDGIVWAAVGAALFGLFMASTYPLAMSLLPSAGYVLSDKTSSRFVIGGALGEMLVPAFIALLLGPASNSIGDGGDSSIDESGRPAALYGACVAASLLLVALYGVSCSLLAAAPTASP